MNALAKNRLKEIADAANAEHTKIEDSLREGLTRAVSVGNLLNEAKKLVQHGEWRQWIADHCQFSERTAQNYMRISARYPELAKSATVADLTYREAVAMLAEPKLEVIDATQTAAEWITRLEWATREAERLKALAAQIVQESEIPIDRDLSPARRMLETAQRLARIEELEESFVKYLEAMRGAMADATRDEIFPILKPELQRKANEWVAWQSSGKDLIEYLQAVQ